MKNETLLFITIVFTAINLTGCGSSSNPSNSTNINDSQPQQQSLMNISDWQTYGTIKKSIDEKLIIGDNIGYDTDDSDNDGNSWGNPNEDDDVAISIKDFHYPINLTFSGTLSPTIYGYHRLGFMYKDNNNKVNQNTGAWFGLDWENGNNLYAYVQSKGIKLLKNNAGVPIKATNGVLTGNFKINWTGTNVTFYYNGENVYKTKLPYDNTKDIKTFVKTFDHPISLSNIVVTEL